MIVICLKATQIKSSNVIMSDKMMLIDQYYVVGGFDRSQFMLQWFVSTRKTER